MKKKINILLAGVGGQGVITAANLLGKAAIHANINVFTSEVHGMAQRGGTVNCMVRFGDVSGPLIPLGCADVILSMEPVEALRYISYANKETVVVTDVNPVVPFTVAVGGEQYPSLDQIYKESQSCAVLYPIDGLKIAKDAGASITKNSVMMGALAGTGLLPFDADVLLETILENVPDKYKAVNKKAFEEGVKAIKNLKAQRKK